MRLSSEAPTYPLPTRPMSFVAAPTQIARDFGLPPWHHPCSLTGAPTSVSSVFLVPLLMVLAVDGGAEPAAHSAGAADATDAGEAPALTDAGPPSADGGAIDALRPGGGREGGRGTARD